MAEPFIEICRLAIESPASEIAVRLQSSQILSVKEKIVRLLKQDPVRWHALDIVAGLNIETACIGAGFVRNLVWDHLHGLPSDCRSHDIAVLWFDRERATPEADLELEQTLRERDAGFDWSVKNQARMHIRNRDEPYFDVGHAMSFWPETATAIAARRHGDDCELIAPFGLDDLTNMVLRPTSEANHKVTAVETRLREENWQTRWPRVTVIARSLSGSAEGDPGSSPG